MKKFTVAFGEDKIIHVNADSEKQAVRKAIQSGLRTGIITDPKEKPVLVEEFNEVVKKAKVKKAKAEEIEEEAEESATEE